MIRHFRTTTAISCSLLAFLSASCSTTEIKSPDGITPGIERPENGDTVSWTSTIQTGKVLHTYQTTRTNDACEFLGYPKVDLLIQPKHGTFSFRKGPALPNVSKSSKCYNVKIPHILGQYRPNAGFVGTDSVRIRSSLGEGGFAYVNITIQVTK
jgi:hypothetical protein